MNEYWYEQARCRELKLPVSDFIPPRGKRPTAEAFAACRECKVTYECAMTRQPDDIGLRAGVFIGDRDPQKEPIILRCARCFGPFPSHSASYKYCEPCRPLAELERERVRARNYRKDKHFA